MSLRDDIRKKLPQVTEARKNIEELEEELQDGEQDAEEQANTKQQIAEQQKIIDSYETQLKEIDRSIQCFLQGVLQNLFVLKKIKNKEIDDFQNLITISSTSQASKKTEGKYKISAKNSTKNLQKTYQADDISDDDDYENQVGDLQQDIEQTRSDFKKIITAYKLQSPREYKILGKIYSDTMIDDGIFSFQNLRKFLLKFFSSLSTYLTKEVSDNLKIIINDVKNFKPSVQIKKTEKVIAQFQETEKKISETNEDDDDFLWKKKYWLFSILN